MVNSNY